MSELNVENIEQKEELKQTEQNKEVSVQTNDTIVIKLEDMKEPTPVLSNETDDDDIVETTKTSKTEFKIEVKPENVLIDGLEHLYSYMKCVHHEKITPANLIVIATELMQIVEKYKGLTGPQKKMLVINVIKKVVNSQIDSDETKNTLNTIIDLTLPVVIDNLISAMNGEIKFNKENSKELDNLFYQELFKSNNIKFNLTKIKKLGYEHN